MVVVVVSPRGVFVLWTAGSRSLAQVQSVPLFTAAPVLSAAQHAVWLNARLTPGTQCQQPANSSNHRLLAEVIGASGGGDTPRRSL